MKNALVVWGTLRYTNIVMEHGSFEDVFRIEKDEILPSFIWSITASIMHSKMKTVRILPRLLQKFPGMKYEIIFLMDRS